MNGVSKWILMKNITSITSRSSRAFKNSSWLYRLPVFGLWSITTTHGAIMVGDNVWFCCRGHYGRWQCVVLLYTRLLDLPSFFMTWCTSCDTIHNLSFNDWLCMVAISVHTHFTFNFCIDPTLFNTFQCYLIQLYLWKSLLLVYHDLVYVYSWLSSKLPLFWVTDLLYKSSDPCTTYNSSLLS